MKKESDHIFPRVEGGSDEPYNKRAISRSANRGKSAKMPKVADVFDSSNPIKLATDIDRKSLKGFKHPQNKNRGFGGLPRK